MTGGGGQVGQCTIYKVNYQRKKQSGSPGGVVPFIRPQVQDRGQGAGAAGEQKLKTEAR